MKTTIKIINTAFEKHEKSALAFSGGSDSIVLLDIIFKKTKHKPPLIFSNSLMEYPSTVRFVKEIAKNYNAELHIAKPIREPIDQFNKTGWPMLGKFAARRWMQNNPDKGFKIDVTACCRNMKIAPARKLLRKLGFTLHFTGQRGNQDDALRGMRSIKDDIIKFIKQDKLFICNPLDGWTDTMIRRYTEENKLDCHPLKKKGAITIGCMLCGGGAQYTNSGFKILRKLNKKAWYDFMVEKKAGEIVLAIKYDVHIDEIRKAIKKKGGLANLAKEKPFIFDFLLHTPIQGYNK